MVIRALEKNQKRDIGSWGWRVILNNEVGEGKASLRRWRLSKGLKVVKELGLPGGKDSLSRQRENQGEKPGGRSEPGLFEEQGRRIVLTWVVWVIEKRSDGQWGLDSTVVHYMDLAFTPKGSHWRILRRGVIRFHILEVWLEILF